MRKLLLLIALAPILSFGQTYIAEAPLPSVPANGFYSVPLTPELNRWLAADLSNLRVIDAKGKEVPYILFDEKPEFDNVEFIPYEMKKQQGKNCCTTLTLINSKRNKISNIILEVKNAETLKEATLRGSDDNEHWYALKEKFFVSGTYDQQASSQLRILDFPLSNYEYFQLVINDSTTTPLNIVKAGYYNTSRVNGTYVEIPNVKFSAADSAKDKETWVRIQFDTTRSFDRIDLEIAGAPFYNRSATIHVLSSYQQKRKTIEYRMPIYDFTLTSTHAASIPLQYRTKEVFIKISNGNSPSLEVKSAHVYQLRRSLVAWLSADQSYMVKAGNDSLTAPIYDLEFFRDSIPATPEVLAVGHVNVLYKPAKIETTPTIFTSKNYIWVAIILVIGILGYMSMRMLKEKK